MSDHRCHAHDCKAPCPPRHLMCARHWRMVPKPIQRLVWDTYRPGQERDKIPTRAYLAAQRMACAAVAGIEGDLEAMHRINESARRFAKLAGGDVPRMCRDAWRDSSQEAAEMSVRVRGQDV